MKETIELTCRKKEVCDICNKPIKISEESLFLPEWDKKVYQHDDYHIYFSKFDLCFDCIEKIGKFITRQKEKCKKEGGI